MLSSETLRRCGKEYCVEETSWESRKSIDKSRGNVSSFKSLHLKKRSWAT